MSDLVDSRRDEDVLVDDETASRAPTVSELLERPGAVLTRRHLRDLGYTRTAIDRIFQTLDVIFFPGQVKGGAVKVEDYLALVERCT